MNRKHFRRSLFSTSHHLNRVPIGISPAPVEPLEARRMLAGQIFITYQGGGGIGEYSTTGAAINASLFPNYGPFGIVASGSDLFATTGVGPWSGGGMLLIAASSANSPRRERR